MYLVTSHQLRPSIVCHEHPKTLLGFGQFDFRLQMVKMQVYTVRPVAGALLFRE